MVAHTCFQFVYYTHELLSVVSVAKIVCNAVHIHSMSDGHRDDTH